MRCVVLFTDLIGFTARSSAMEPEHLFALLNRYFEVMAAPVLAEQGLLDKFIGDSVMADSYPLKALSSDKETWSSSFVSRTGDDVDATISTIAVCVSGFNPTIVFAPTIAN